MQRQTQWQLLGIAILTVLAVWIAMPNNPGIHRTFGSFTIDRSLDYRRGLDLQGGLQVVMEADPREGQVVDADTMEAVRGIIDSRVNGLGVSEPLIQLVGNNRIVVELPGLKDPDQAIAVFGETGLLEFIDAGNTPLQEGTIVRTDEGKATDETGTTDGTTAPTPTAVTDTQAVAGPVYHTVLSGEDLQTAEVGFDQTSQPQIHFTFKSGEPAQTLAKYTQDNIGRYLAITLDKKVLSSPVIQNVIPDGSGVINGRFTLEEARGLVIQLKYGSLPVPLKVIENRTIGATLGEDSVRRSLFAGLIGIGAVALFMILYYRLPGIISVVALAIYTALTLSVFKLVPVTLTLAGIAGFILSVGMAVDANVLIFERIKEELRAGRTLSGAVRAGFDRAWPSIRDSNASTLITCGLLFWFGATFGASIVKGFALTLAIGVLISLFTAITITRTFMRTIMGMDATAHRNWFGY